MSPLAAAAAQHNAAKDQQETERQRDHIAKARERWRGIGGGRENRVDHAGLTPRERLHDIAAAVDHRTDSGWRRTQHRQALLGSAQARLGEVLRGAPAPEPGVVRRVEDESRAVLLIDYLPRKDDFVAKLEPDFA